MRLGLHDMSLLEATVLEVLLYEVQAYSSKHRVWWYLPMLGTY